MTKNPFKLTSLSERVVEYLKDEIFLGHYKGGDRILEAQLANELEISRAPIREAIKELEHQGLLKSIPRKGTFVSEFSKEDIKEIYDIRIYLEQRILDILIKEARISEQDYKNLDAMIKKMLIIANSEQDRLEKVVQITREDIAFHQYLWKISGSKWTTKILYNIYYQLQLAMIIDSQSEDNLVDSVMKHYEILKYIRESNLEKAKEALEKHILLRSKDYLE